MARRGRPPKNPKPDLVGTPTEEVVEPKVEAPKGDYIYRCKDCITICLQIPKEEHVRQPNGTFTPIQVKQKVRVKFNDVLHTLIVNEGLAAALDTTVEDINFYLQKWPSYGNIFMLVSAPGLKPSEEVIAFDRICEKTVAMKKGRQIIQGPKSSSNVT